MSVFEEVIDSVIKIYVTNHKHTVVGDPFNKLEVLYDQKGQHLLITLNLPENKKIHASLYFYTWAIKSSISTDHAQPRAVLQFAEMIEFLMSNFSIVYKNVKW